MLFLVPIVALSMPWLAVVAQAVLAGLAAFARARMVERISGMLSAIFLMNIALIGCTYDEGNGRFLVPLWPLLIGFAAAGIEPVLKRFASRSVQNAR